MQSAVWHDIVSFVVIGCEFAALLYCRINVLHVSESVP